MAKHMAGGEWNWKHKNGVSGGLLYESGNWGDIIKMLWVSALIRWKQRAGAPANYFDPFAGDVQYPLGPKTGFRLAQAWTERLAWIREAFVEKGVWPSAASGAMLLAGGKAEVWDADPTRRDRWREVPGVLVAEERESGWRLLERRAPDPDGVWIIDPYDFLADWRETLPMVAEKSETTSILVYLYNRSARSAEAFAEYRAFRKALDVMRKGLPMRLGRVPADAFLPRAHHEMLCLPSVADCGEGALEALWIELEECAGQVAAGVRRAEIIDC